MSQVRIDKISKGYYQVIKGARPIGTIQFMKRNAPGNWTGEVHWSLKHAAGRIDRHDSLAAARDDALKL